MEILNILPKDQSCAGRGRSRSSVFGRRLFRICIERANELGLGVLVDPDRTGDNRHEVLGKRASLVGTPDGLTIVSQDRIMRTTSSNIS
jgi:hypothetical protein